MFCVWNKSKMRCVPLHRNAEVVRMQCDADELMCMIWCVMSQTFEYSRYQQVHGCMHHVLTKILLLGIFFGLICNFSNDWCAHGGLNVLKPFPLSHWTRIWHATSKPIPKPKHMQCEQTSRKMGATWENEREPTQQLAKEPVLGTQPETLLGTLLDAWEPLPGNLAWEPLPGTLLGNLFLEPCLGTCSWKPYLETCSWESCFPGPLLLAPVPGNLAWEPRVKTLPGIPGKLACKTFPGNVAWKPFPGNLTW